MKILYLANIRLPTEKAHGAQIMHMCAAFALIGAEVELIVPRRRNPICDDPFAYYGLKENFKITRVWTLDTIYWGLGYWVQLATFSIAALLRAFRRGQADIYFSRDEFILYLLSFFRDDLVWESHTGRYNRIIKQLLKGAWLVVLTEGAREFYVEKGVDPTRIIVAHDGIDLSLFGKKIDAPEARADLGLPLDKRIALYAGRLDGWKGVNTFCAASEFLPDNVRVVVIGGSDAELGVFRKRYPRVIFVGFRPYRDIARSLAGADVLVLPNTGRDIISTRFTSPLKLFAYMAAGKPIIASDLPSIREVLDDESGYLVVPDEPGAFAHAINRVLADNMSSGKAARAQEKVKAYTWSLRAKKILEALQSGYSVTE